VIPTRLPGYDHTVTLCSSTTRPVHCEQCGCDYTYEMVRSASGTARSVLFLNGAGAKAEARAEASRHLTQFMTDCDPVACPDCGWLQKDMVKHLRQRWFLRLTLLLAAVAACVYLGFTFYAAGESPRRQTLLESTRNRVLLTACGVYVPLCAFALLRNYNGNLTRRRATTRARRKVPAESLDGPEASARRQQLLRSVASTLRTADSPSVNASDAAARAADPS
jgi:hypothetical protein